METFAAVGTLALDHVGIAVPDLDEAIERYTTIFGGRLEHREHNAEQKIDEAMIVFDNSTAAARIQLIAPSSPDSTIAKFIDKNGPGLQQIAIRVADISQASAVLQQRGLRLLYDEPRNGTAGSKINFVHPKDAGGVLVELVQTDWVPA